MCVVWLDRMAKKADNNNFLLSRMVGIKIAVTQNICSSTIGTEQGFNPKVVEASSDLKGFRCMNLGDHELLRKVLHCDWNCNRKSFVVRVVNDGNKILEEAIEVVSARIQRETRQCMPSYFWRGQGVKFGAGEMVEKALH